MRPEQSIQSLNQTRPGMGANAYQALEDRPIKAAGAYNFSSKFEELHIEGEDEYSDDFYSDDFETEDTSVDVTRSEPDTPMKT